jgi:hypothetical protein
MALTAGGTASAQSSDVETRAPDARARFLQGLEHYRHGDYDEALAAFRESHGLDPRPVVLFNLGIALRALSRYADAISTFDRYLREEGLSRRQRADAARELRSLRRLVAPLEIQVHPPGANIRIDGRVVGTSPLGNSVALSPGDHLLEVQRDGYATERRQITLVAAQPASVVVRLEERRDPAYVRITSDPDGALGTLDGWMPLETPWEGDVPPGEHSVQLHESGYSESDVAFTLSPGQERDIHVDLSRSTIFGSPWFWVGIGAGAAAALTVVLFFLLQPKPQVRGTFDPSVVEALTW